MADRGGGDGIEVEEDDEGTVLAQLPCKKNVRIIGSRTSSAFNSSPPSDA